ncbi:MAG: pirin family protein [Steroidobacteraceae bacterium]
MIDLVINARRHDLGGFEVGRLLPYAKRRMVGPFIFFDHMGPVQLAPGLPRSMDVRPHPHIGLSTITYLFAGEIVHRDSVGCEQVIRAGDVNWMTAGRGISHSERFDTMREHGGRLDGIQAWVALPEDQQEIAPAFIHMDGPELPQVELPGASLRIIAGSAFGATSTLHTHSPLFYVHAQLDAGAQLDVPDGYSERAIYVADGGVEMDGQEYAAGQMIVLTQGVPAQLICRDAATVMMLGGEPIGARHIWWNFVSSSHARIEQARADWREGRIPLPVGDDREFIPLPRDPPPPPEPMS